MKKLNHLIFLSIIVTLFSCQNNQKENEVFEWREIDKSHFLIEIPDEQFPEGIQKLVVSKTENGETAIGIIAYNETVPKLVALIGENYCHSLSGTEKSELAHQKAAIKIPDRNNLVVKPLKYGQMEFADPFQLNKGEKLMVFGWAFHGAQEKEMKITLSDEMGIFMHVGPYRTKGTMKSLDKDINFPMEDDIEKIVYGMLGHHTPMGIDTTYIMLVICDETTSPPTIVREVEIEEDGMTIAILGNNLNNTIRHTSRIVECADGRLVLPCNPDWNFSEFWITGMGGDDNLLGIDDPDTRNVVFGDFECSSFTDGGTAGRDHIHGGPGDDILSGEEGDDFIHGGDGWDRIYGNLISCGFSGGSDSDHLFGGPGGDRIYGDSPDEIDAGDTDYILGEAGNDTLIGCGGDDDLFGESYPRIDCRPAGRDMICGSAGRDHIWAGPLRDEIYIDEDDVVSAEDLAEDFITETECLWD
ncbi:MAG: calcium-binding protein [Prolixibacteraceae bacterium]|nr:calcium-binding protein [Prolixibacteraceae bacterium]